MVLTGRIGAGSSAPSRHGHPVRPRELQYNTGVAPRGDGRRPAALPVARSHGLGLRATHVRDGEAGMRTIGSVVAFPHQHEWLLAIGGLVAGGGQGLQNGGTSVIRLTSRRDEPDFPKLTQVLVWSGRRHDPLGSDSADGIGLRRVQMMRRRPHLDEDLDEEGRQRPRVASAPVDRAASLCCAVARDFGADTHGIYRRAALKRCQRKGDRPRGGFRLPWARCRTNARDGLARGYRPEIARRSDRGSVNETFPSARRG